MIAKIQILSFQLPNAALPYHGVLYWHNPCERQLFKIHFVT